MWRGKVGTRPVLDTTLLSTSAIGSPAAFSTAIKPPSNFSTQPSSADSSLVAQQPHNHTHLSGNLPGQLSLSLASEASPTEGLATDDTSLGILDLDNMQESSMSLFLTSPRTSQDLHNLMATHPPVSTLPTSHPLPPSPSTTSPLPSMGPLILSEAHTSSKLGDMRTEAPAIAPVTTARGGGAGRLGEVESELNLSQDLLENSGSSSDGESVQSEGERGEEAEGRLGQTSSMEEEVEESVPSPPSPGFNSDHVRQSGDGHETGLTRLLGQGPPPHLPSSGHSPSVTFSVPEKERDSKGFSVAEILQAAERDGEELRSNDLFLASKTDTSLIGDQEEPSLMRKAAEFSQFEPDHLVSMMTRDSLLHSSRVSSSLQQPVLNSLPQSSVFQHLITSSSSKLNLKEHPITVTTPSQQLHLQRAQKTFSVPPPALPLSVTDSPSSGEPSKVNVLHNRLNHSHQVRPSVEGSAASDSPTNAVTSSAISLLSSSVQKRLSGSEETHGIPSSISAGRPLDHLSSNEGWSGGRAAETALGKKGNNQPGEGGEESDSDSEASEQYTSTSPEGLPSAYLQPSSVYSSASQTPSHSLSHTPSLTRTPSPPPSPSPTHHTHSQVGWRDGRGEEEGEKGKEAGGSVSGKEQHSSSYNPNPFDSEDAASVQDMGEEEFGAGLDSGSFLAHLAADEAAVQEANKLMLPESFAASTPHTCTSSFAHLSPSSTSQLPTLLQSGEKELSIGTYFGQRSYKLGVLETLGVAPNERPHFSASSSGLIQSPPTPLKDDAVVQSKNTPTSPTSSASPDPVDTTLLATQDGSSVEKSPSTQSSSTVQHSHSLTGLQQSARFTTMTQTHSLPSQLSSEALLISHTPHTEVQVPATTATLPTPAQVHVQAVRSHVGTPATDKLAVVSCSSALSDGAQEQVQTALHTAALATRGRVSAGMVDSLTPVVTVHTPFPMQFKIPKLDLSGLSKTVDSTPSTRTSTGLKLNPPTLSAEFKHHPTTNPLTQTVYSSVPTVTCIGSSPALATTAEPVLVSGTVSSSIPSPDMEFGLQQSGLDSGLSSGIEPRLASQYWKPSIGSSTLIFPELSAATLSPPPAEVDGLSIMPTPSMAHLSGGFNTSSQDGSFLESLLGALPTTSVAQWSAFEHPSKFPKGLQHSPSTNARTTAEAVVSATTQVTSVARTQTLTLHSLETGSPPLTSIRTSPATGTKVKKTSHHSPPITAVESNLSPPKLPRSTQSPLVSSTTPPNTTTASSTPQTTARTQSGESTGKTRTPKEQRPPSPKVETAKRKLVELKATLDSTQFDASAYLSSLRKERGDAVAQPSEVAAKGAPISEAVTSLPSPNPHQEVSVASRVVVSQSATVTSQGTTATGTSTTVTSKSAMMVSQSATVTSHSAPAVSQGDPVASQSAPMVSQSTSQPWDISFPAASSTATTLTATSMFLHMSPSPQKSATTSLSPATRTTLGPAPSSSKMQPSSSSLQQTDGETQQHSEMKRVVQKTTKRDQQVVESSEAEHQNPHQYVAVRDIGVGTTPGLRRAQTRSSTLVTSHRAEETSVSSSVHSDSTLPVTTAQQSPPKPRSPVRTTVQTKISETHSSSPQRHSLLSSQSPPSQSSLIVSSRQEHSPSHPIYTSPRLFPHTSSLSPPPQLHSQPLTYRERRKTPEPNALKVPDSLCFKLPCCMGVTLSDQLQITNVGDRWLQLSFELSQLYCNGVLCQTTEISTFSFPQRCFVSPRKTESIKVTFSPKQAGNYEGILACKAKLVISSEEDSNCLSESIVVKALAVSPKLKVATSSLASGGTLLDYGVLVSGSSLSLPLHLTNHGTSELPLRLAISAPTLSQLYFSFEELHPPLKIPPTSPSSYLHTRPFSTTLILPPKPQGKSKKPEVYSVKVHFKSPKNYMDDVSPLGPPEEIKAQINISVEGPNSTGTLCSVPIKAIVGVPRLHVPRSLQALSLSCPEKKSVSREVPFKNAGNISLWITLKCSTSCDHFQVTPNSLELSPAEETQVSVSFSPPTSPLTIDGYLMIHVEPNGPDYELKLRGTATKEDDSENRDPGRENLLFCNKRLLYWGSVDLRDSVEQELLLQNNFSSAVPLQLSIRHQNQAFQLHSDSPPSVCWARKADLPKRGQLQVHILFTPPSKSVFHNALDIYDTVHSKKFRIPLCGYGGASVVEVVNARRSTSKGLWVDLGAVAVQQCSTVKVSLYNSGIRAAFVKALCFPLDEGENISPLPFSRAGVSPAEFVLHPQQMQDLSVVYQPSSSEEVARCSETATPLARLVLLNGDEIIRQRLQRAMAAGAAGSEQAEREDRQGGEGRECRLNNTFNETFLQRFPGQESVPSELDFSLFEVENEEKLFEQHVQQTTITLLGSPMTETPIPKQTHHLSTSFDSPPKALHTLSPSHSLLQATPPGHTHQATPSSCITSSHTLILPDSAVGRYSEKMLDIHNPYSQPLHWQLSSVASPFVRDTVSMSSDICKANYSAFWVHERRGTVLPHSTSQVSVKFQPHDIGSFSQIWDLQVSCGEIESGSKKIRLSFGGRAVSGESVRPQPSSLAPHVHFAPAAPRSIPHPAPSHTLTKRRVYIKEETVEFPPTKVGSQSILKVKVCNRDSCQHQFQVIPLSPPFSVDHHTFKLGSRQCARLPVHFSPSQPGLYEGVLAVRTTTGHQAFSQLTGLATTDEPL